MHFRLKDSVKRQIVSASLHHPALQGSEPIESPGVRRKAVEEASDCVEMPEKCRPRQCLDCFYDKKLPHSARIYTYWIQQRSKEQVKSEHFSQYEPGELRSCPTCEIIVESEMHFKNHT